jgi:hypothetical protein
MSGAYAASVRAHAPHAIVTFDGFHVIKVMNERLDDLRRELAREAQDHQAREAIKALRWLLLKRRDNLEKDAARRLERNLALNEPRKHTCPCAGHELAICTGGCHRRVRHCKGGPARGYLNRTRLLINAERLVADPYGVAKRRIRSYESACETLIC